jgi:hypothetical protein
MNLLNNLLDELSLIPESRGSNLFLFFKIRDCKKIKAGTFEEMLSRWNVKR